MIFEHSIWAKYCAKHFKGIWYFYQHPYEIGSYYYYYSNFPDKDSKLRKAKVLADSHIYEYIVIKSQELLFLK